MTKKSGIAIRHFLTSLHKTYLPDMEAMREAGRRTGLSVSAVNQAVVNGKGSAITHGLLLCHGLQMQPEALINLVPKFRGIVSGAEKISHLEQMIHKVLRVYSADEVIVFLDLMLAKEKMERNLGLRKKQGRPKLKAPKKVFSSL